MDKGYQLMNPFDAYSELNNNNYLPLVAWSRELMEQVTRTLGFFIETYETHNLPK